MSNWVMLVDSWKHRVAKIDGQWRMYCPQRGTESLIYAPDFYWVKALMRTPCPHIDEYNWPIGGLGCLNRELD